MKMDELQNALELLDDELITEVGQARMNARRPNRMIFFILITLSHDRCSDIYTQHFT